MDLDDMMKQHQLWLDKAHQTLTSSKAESVTPADLKQPRIEQIQARIADLTRHKEREIQRYDKAIAELERELAGLTAETSPRGASRPAGTAAKKPSKRAAKAKAKK